ncbi:MFS transporter [Novosphingobium sp. Gsoil 351]|uniref:MFS transporter n=1 Tax=Novosphingobium sp. Gsoil 351 TaxID=2675225 RepID=UPI0012B47D42|nr:glycoside-pentoside-hexuronide (GPH):cation symporter [Novosphingobium sp. Gsoil 351]QGN55673.1 MFS transporter [Novosphingobium sp. Gsoil 351]
MTAHRLSMAGKVGFTLGDYASNLYWQSVSIFLLFFYTDAVGLSAATAGLIYMIASIVDALADPIMGSIADRTRTSRGRYRPYILFGCVPLGLSFVLLYWRPPFEGLLLTLWMMMSHIVFRFAYTAVTIPYTSLNARLTDNSDERSTLAGWRMTFGVLAALTISYFTYPLVGMLGNGNAANGYTYAAAVFAVIATAIYPLVYAITCEPAELPNEEPRLTLGGYWRGLAPNRAFWVLVAATVVASICTFALGKSILYYFKYYLHDEAAARFALAAMAVSGLAIIPGWVWLTKSIGKRNAWLAAVAWALVMLAIFQAFDFRSALSMTIWLVAWSVGSLGFAMTFWSMLPDTVEYGEWTSGARTESFIFGLFQFFLKAALGIGAGLFGWLLQHVGYVANTDQSPETLAGIKAIMVWMPGAGVFLAGLIMLAYPLKRGTHEAIVEELNARMPSPDA